MKDLLKRRWLTALLMGIVFAVFFRVLSFIDSPVAFGELTPTEVAIGAPLVAGLVIGIVSWALMSAPQEGESESLGKQGACRKCGGTVLAEWHLCPHCGAVLSDPVRRDTASI